MNICIAKEPSSRETWCGAEPVYQFLFLSLEHAAQESVLLPCQDCLTAAIAPKEQE